MMLTQNNSEVVAVRFGWTELVLVLLIALIIFGPGKLPDVGGALGKAIGEFRKGASEKEEKPEEKG